MKLLIDKIKMKFELYRFCLPKSYKLAFDKILDKTDDRTVNTTPGGFEAIVLNQLIDMEERLRLLESRNRTNK
jgi:hypothetical protein